MRGDTGLGRDALGTGQASAAQVQEASPLPGLHGHFQAPGLRSLPAALSSSPRAPSPPHPAPLAPSLWPAVLRSPRPRSAPSRQFPCLPGPSGQLRLGPSLAIRTPPRAVHTDPTVLSHVCNTQTRTRSCTHALTHAPYMRTHHTDTKHTCAHAHACTHACANIHMHALAHRHTYMYTHLHAGTHADRVAHVCTCATCMQVMCSHTCSHACRSAHALTHTQTRSRTCMLTHMQTHTCSQTQRTTLTHSHSQTRAHTWPH